MFCALGSIHKIVEGRSQAGRALDLFFNLGFVLQTSGFN